MMTLKNSDLEKKDTLKVASPFSRSFYKIYWLKNYNNDLAETS